jgi:hypothetical protein
MDAEATLPLPALDTFEPFRGCCPACRADVLVVTVDGAECVVDVAEVLEAFACPSCAQVALRGHVRSDCSRCKLTGVIGVALPLRGVAINSRGAVRSYRGARVEGEAVHSFHTCRG